MGSVGRVIGDASVCGGGAWVDCANWDDDGSRESTDGRSKWSACQITHLLIVALHIMIALLHGSQWKLCCTRAQEVSWWV